MLIKDTVDAVRQAELKAMEMEKEVLKQKEEIINKAHSDAKELKDSIIKKALENVDNKLLEVEKRNEEVMNEYKKDAQKEVMLLKENVKNKEAAAIKAVLSEVI